MSLESRAVRVLCAFYAKHESSKTQADIEAIVAKRAKKTGVLTEQAFADVCSKLAAKYGECPMAFGSDSDDDYNAAFDDGQPPWRPGETQFEAETELSLAAAQARLPLLLAEIKLVEDGIFAWESSHEGLSSPDRRRLASLRSELAAVKIVCSQVGGLPTVTRVVETAVVGTCADTLWAALRAFDFAWSARVVAVCPVLPIAEVGGNERGEQIVGRSQRIIFAQGGEWTVKLAHLSDSKRAMSFSVVNATADAPAAPQLFKFKVRPVSVSGKSFLQCAALLPAGAQPEIIAAAKLDMACQVGDLRAALTGKG